MSEDIFIGREKELQMIDEMVFDPTGSSHYFPIVGSGGVGKTLLMKKLYNRYSQYSNIIIVVCLEFSEVNYQSFPLVILQAADQLSVYITPRRALELRSLLSNWEQLMVSGTVIEKPQEIEDSVFQFASEVFTEVTKHKRLVLLSDTTETIKPVEYGYYLNTFAATAQNAVLVAAGRPTESVLTLYGKRHEIYKGWIVHDIYELNPFSVEETEKYFNSIFALPLPEEMRDKIFFLTEGNPVLISIAGEWFIRHIELPEYIDLPLEQLQSLDEESLSQYRERFEFELIEKIRTLRTPIDWAVLYLAFLNRRYNRRILKIILPELKDFEIDQIVNELQSISFMRKSMSGEVGSLHDEAQRLIQKHAWPIVDLDGSIRRGLAQKVIEEYYLPEIDRLRKIVEAVVAEALKSIDSILSEPAIPPIPYEDILKQTLQIECLDYQFRISQEVGLAYLDELIEEAINQRSFVFFDTINQSIYNLATPEKRNQTVFQVRLAEILQARKQADRAINLAQKVLDTPNVLANDAARALYVLGCSVVDPQGKAKYLEIALEKSRISNDVILQSSILRELGLHYRRTGYWSKADDNYRKALSLLNPETSSELYANTLNNLAYVVMLCGKLERADILAERALRLRREIKSRPGLAFSHFTKGRIADARGDYAGAMREYRAALAWFRSIPDKENEAWVQVDIAQVERRAYRFEEARKLLVPALESLRPDIRAEALSQDAKVAIDEAEAAAKRGTAPDIVREMYIDARKGALAALTVAETQGDVHLQAVELFDLALITFLVEERADVERMQALETLLSEHDFPLEHAYLTELRGSIAYIQGDITRAFMHYLEACRILADYNIGHFRRVFERVRSKFLDASLASQLQICRLWSSSLQDLPPQSPLKALRVLCQDDLGS